MGKKNNKKVENQIKQFILFLISLIIVVIAAETGILDKIDNLLATAGLAEVANSIENTNEVVIETVKQNSEVIANVSENIVINKDKLNILYLDVGQADCTLIIYKDKSLLIDSGNSKDGELIVNGIRALGISKLDYVIGTHVHEDHVGGMNYIIDSFDIGKFYLPYDSKTTSSYYKKILTSLTQKQLEITEANIGDKFAIEDVNFEIMFVDNDEPEDANDSSIVVEMTYGELKYLFMGDATQTNEETRTWNDIDVLKVGHHGSNTSSSQEFLNQVLPEISIISVGKDNSYGLPKDKILDRLNKLGTTIYRTDTDGTIQILSDGKKNEIVKIDVSFDGNE